MIRCILAYKQDENIEASNSTSRYLDGLLNSDNTYFDGMVNQIYPSELQLNTANSSDIEALFLDMKLLTISDSFNMSKIYDKHNDFDFDIHSVHLETQHIYLHVCSGRK